MKNQLSQIKTGNSPNSFKTDLLVQGSAHYAGFHSEVLLQLEKTLSNVQIFLLHYFAVS